MDNSMQAPKRVAAYVRPWSLDYYRYFIARAFGNSEAVYLSDWKGLGDFDISLVFTHFMGKSTEELRVPNWLDHYAEYEITKRNYLLRSLPYGKAKHLIRAMSQAIERALDAIKPDAMLSPAVDSYVMDLLKRHCVARRIPYCGMLPCPFPNQTRITAVGEQIYFRTPTEDEVVSAISALQNPSFKTVDLTEWLKMYGARNVHVKRALRELPKRYLFPLVGRLRGDKLNYHYMSSSLSKVSFFSQALFSDGIFEERWRDIMSRWKGQKIFMPLQAFPECTFDYHVKELDLIDYPALLLRIIDTIAHDDNVLVCIKEHPGMLGARPPGFYKLLQKRKNVLLIPSREPSADVIAGSDVVMTWTGTAGLEGILRGKPLITIGAPFYSHGSSAINVRSLRDLDDLVDMIRLAHRIEISDAEKRVVARNVLAGTFPGEYRFIRFRESDKALSHDAEALATSTAKYWQSWHEGFARHCAGDWAAGFTK